MRPRRKNLLDSFRNASGASPARPMIEAPRPAARLPKAQKPKPVARDDEEGAASDPSRSRKLLLVALFLATATLVAVTWHKVKSDSTVDAGATEAPVAASSEPKLGPPDSTTPKPPPAAVPQGRGGTQHDKAFLDTANRFTVRVGQYADDARGRAEALANYDYLTDSGMPCVMPVRSGKYLILCAGYAPKLDSKLQALRESIAALRGPKGSKRPPFATAWIDNIDNIVRR